MAHVKPQIIFPAKHFSAVITGEALRDVTGLHVNIQLRLIRQNLVAYWTLIGSDLLKVNQVVLVEFILCHEGNSIAFALTIAALKVPLIVNTQKVLISLQLDDERFVFDFHSRCITKVCCCFTF